MNTATSAALVMVLCGLLGAAAGAATPEDPAPSIVIKYDPRSLATDAGTTAVYRRLVKAAEAVCPGAAPGSRIPSAAAYTCRQQAVARAVHLINNPRLVALGAPREKTG